MTTTTRHRRLGWLLAALACAGVATALVLNAFRGNLVFFFSPTQVAAQEAPAGRAFRLGGLVETGSLRREGDGMTIRFIVTDTVRQVPVIYRGLLPDLFREGKGVVARGQLRDGVFQATEVLAKHDENYMPPEAAEALKQAAQTRARTPEATPR
ncbi:cytochrome c maturation protein CcmE [Cupriavidus campinensis]|uniref:cytochrome c maturation protein CcmE n=1 Tax=Cupriavidus campinensis TaxID=151783 RepID=UPI0011ED90F9|nr:cytochrome c maturation protein CcmE [Cupriavidus campinensis]